ncbi:MAG: hypothetical protein ABR962_06125 [Candidatus Bathyarchaeia archaeon]|jgi:hypothetical protein
MEITLYLCGENQQRSGFLEAPERNVTWILVVSLILFFGSIYIFYMWPNYTYPAVRDAWFNLYVVDHLFFTLALGSSALCLAHFAEKSTYYLSILFFAVSMSLLFVLGLRPFF